jgi:hypothetical protein
MSTLSVGTIKSDDALPPVIQNTSGTEIGTFCRAWVNFNGTGTVAIRAAFNVSSITDNNVGDYTVNFTNAMPDANYAVSIASSTADNNSVAFVRETTAMTASLVRIGSSYYAGSPAPTAVDRANISVSIFK